MLDAEPEFFPFDALDGIECVEHRNRSGDIQLRQDVVIQKDRRAERLSGFFAIPKVRETAALIRRLAGGETVTAPATPSTTRVPASMSRFCRSST